MHKQDKHLLLKVGPNGSGKGTVSKRLNEELLKRNRTFIHVESGRLCRHTDEFAHLLTPELMGKITGYCDKGDLVPDDVMHTAIGFLLQPHADIDVIALDGYPRTLTQFALILEWAEKNDRKVTIVYMHTPMEECLERMKERKGENGEVRGDDAQEETRMNRIINFIRVTCKMTYKMRHEHAKDFVQLDGTDARTVDLSEILNRIPVLSPLRQEELELTPAT
jgi:adenylate kinase family enzyme